MSSTSPSVCARRDTRHLPTVCRRAAATALALALSAGLAALPAAAAEPSTGQPTAREKKAAQLRAAAEATVRQLKLRTPRARAVWRLGQSGPQLLSGVAFQTRGANAEARARHFLRAHPTLLGGVDARDLRLDHVSRSHDRQVVRFAQSASGLPVLDRFVAVTLDRRGVAIHFSSDARALGPVTRGPVSASQAARAATLAMQGRSRHGVPKGSAATWVAQATTKVVVVSGLGLGAAVHGYAVDVAGPAGPWRVVIRSADGRVHLARPRARR